jgi:hypothetical protein
LRIFRFKGKPKRESGVRLLRQSTVLVSLALTVSLFVVSQAPAKDSGGTNSSASRTTTRETDDAFGAGGTKDVTSDDHFRVVGETWRDKDGTVRETHIFTSGTDGQPQEMWVFKTNDGAGHVDIQRNANGTWNLQEWENPAGILRDFRGVSRDQIDKWVHDIQAQVASDGTMAEAGAPRSLVEKPVLPPMEKNLGSVKPDRSKEEPKSAVEQPSLPPSENNLAPAPKADTPKSGAPKVIGSAPKSCGDVKDPQTALAMGCIGGPPPIAPVASTSVPPPPPAKSSDDDFDPFAGCAVSAPNGQGPDFPISPDQSAGRSQSGYAGDAYAGGSDARRRPDPRDLPPCPSLR